MKKNNFDLLRMLFAVIVFLAHACELSGSLTLSPLATISNTIFSATFAVKSFFVVSGFLIFMSFENSSSIRTYFAKRLRRIYPAYFVVVMSCALLGVFFTQTSLGKYFSLALIKYLLANLFFLNFIQPSLPGLFSNNPIVAVNGSLWTLKIEVLFYLCVPIFVLAIRRFGNWQVLLGLYVASLLYSVTIEMWGLHTGSPIYQELLRQLPGQLVYFVSGALLYYNLDRFIHNWKLPLVTAIFILLIKNSFLTMLFEPISVGIIVIYAAYVFTYLGNFSRYGDFSYGIYIVHFPVLQVLIQYGLFESNPILALFLAAIIVFVLSYLLWHRVEKPFLRKSSHYAELSK